MGERYNCLDIFQCVVWVRPTDLPSHLKLYYGVHNSPGEKTCSVASGVSETHLTDYYRHRNIAHNEVFSEFMKRLIFLRYFFFQAKIEL